MAITKAQLAIENAALRSRVSDLEGVIAYLKAQSKASAAAQWEEQRQREAAQWEERRQRMAAAREEAMRTGRTVRV